MSTEVGTQKNWCADVDIITAAATAIGRSSVAIIRLSGINLKKMMVSLVGKELQPRQATYLNFLNAQRKAIDQGIAIFFPAPHSYTGEDVLELQGHGGNMMVDLLLKRTLELGARLARPGEFSERAFLNGKIDLAQAEAVADLIDATSAHAARSAFRSLQGDFSKAVNEINAKIIHLRMHVEVAIDFSDEKIQVLETSELLNKLTNILAELTALQKEAKQGSLLRDGLSIVLTGKPNVGKSSLLNSLSGKDIAIVTPLPGTTRDVLREHILIDNIPLRIIDTAGLRQGEDLIEQEGIRRAYQEISQADLVLYIFDASEPSTLNLELTASFPTCPIIFVRNKIDLLNENPTKQRKDKKIIISLSAQYGDGMELLKEEIKAIAGFQPENQGIFLARRRHLTALKSAHLHLETSRQQLSEANSLELAAEDLRLAQAALAEITGQFTPDDLLGEIFSSFCIGK